MFNVYNLCASKSMLPVGWGKVNILKAFIGRKHIAKQFDAGLVVVCCSSWKHVMFSFVTSITAIAVVK